MRKLIFALMFILYSVQVYSQIHNPNQPPNTYAQGDNPLYWKNRPPYPGYWQQDIYYKIDAKIDEEADIIDGELTLIYWNNSPDELDFVFFHLYNNAFQPGSYYDNLIRNNKITPRYGKYENQGLGTKIEQLWVNGKEVEMELDNTILKVWLPQTLKKGDHIEFYIKFKTYFDPGGNVRRRMKTFNAYGYKHYDGVHWYPRMAVYDRKAGWNTNQHLGHEFYGNFGTYDVKLTLASNFVVEATGTLQNRDKVLPNELRQKLDIKNFASKPWGEKPSVITPYVKGETKTWHFYAENVHDFAFTADPTYRIGEAEWNGIKAIAVVQEPHASRWQNAAEFAIKCVKVYSEDFGMYEYPKMVVADARDGMEYPMLTLNGGYDPNYRGLFAHEIAHNWFFGMVANNETYRPALDEGFTQFLEVWALEKIDGKYEVRLPYKSKYVEKFYKQPTARFKNAYWGYLEDAIRHRDESLNTHADMFNGAIRHDGGYRHVYYKTAVMLFNLQYVLGDSLFQKAMQHYFNQWKFAHPYDEDMRNSIIQFTKVDLNWFFDQWFNTTKRLDYAVKSVKKGKQKDEYKITFERKERMQMPIDFRVTAKDGKTYDFYIPNTWFEKKTNATVLPRWIGWDNLQPLYEATVIIPGGIKNVEIDPSGRLADINKLDNSLKCNIEIDFDHNIVSLPNWDKYQLKIRPDLWYNGFDGLKVGAHFNGHYMKFRRQFDASVFFNTGLAQQDWDLQDRNSGYDLINFRINYKSQLYNVVKGLYWNAHLSRIDGLNMAKLGLEYFGRWYNRDKFRFYAYVKAMQRPNEDKLLYLIYRDQWQAENWNNTFNLGFDKPYRYKNGVGNWNVDFRSGVPTSDYQFAQLSVTNLNTYTLGKIELRSRIFLQYGTGNTPMESSLFLAGANPEEMMDNPWVRSYGFFPHNWYGYGTNTNRFHHGGGLNVRGYAGYLAVDESEGIVDFVFRGNKGAAINYEIDFDRLIKWKPRKLARVLQLDTYIFADAGAMGTDIQGRSLAMSGIRASAGIGSVLTVKNWGPWSSGKPITIRFDMPLFLNRTPAESPEFVQFRYLVGVSRAF